MGSILRKVRFAPSPTGRLHLGGLRTALFNMLHAEPRSGFFLRLDDTDAARTVAGGAEAIAADLAWAGVSPAPSSSASPFAVIQSRRLPLYKRAADDLIAASGAYRCFCTPERLQEARAASAKAGRPHAYDGRCRSLAGAEADQRAAAGEPHVVRGTFREASGSIAVADGVFGRVVTKREHLDDSILVKTDGRPTYHLASVVDDNAEGVTDVVRGEEWLPSTPKHVALYDALGWTKPTFHHLPLLLDEQRRKLSKRSAASDGQLSAVGDFRDAGYLPEAVVNFVALLGWHPPEGVSDVLSAAELRQHFAMGPAVQRAPAVVDSRKLRHLQSEHLARMIDSDMPRAIGLLRPLLSVGADRDDAYLGHVLSALRSRITFVKDVPDLCSYFFKRPDLGAPEALKLRPRWWGRPDDVRRIARRLGAIAAGDFGDASVADVLAAHCDEAGVKYAQIARPLRFALTGTSVGAGLGATMAVLGQAESVARLEAALAEAS